MDNLDSLLNKLQLEAGWVSAFGKTADIFLKGIEKSIEDKAEEIAGKQQMKTKSGEMKPMPEGVAKALMYLRNAEKIHSALLKKFTAVCDKKYDVKWSKIQKEQGAHCKAKAKVHSFQKTISVLRAKKKSCGASILCHQAYEKKIQGLKLKKKVAEAELEKSEKQTFFKSSVKFGKKRK